MYFVDPVRARQTTRLHVITSGAEFEARLEPKNCHPHIEVWKANLPVGILEFLVWQWTDGMDQGDELSLKCDTSKGDCLVVRTWGPDPCMDVRTSAPLFK